MIRKNCEGDYISNLASMTTVEEIGKYHRDCSKIDCPVKFFFQEKVYYIFSIANFSKPEVYTTCRVPLTKEHRTTVYGKMVSFEYIPEKTDFNGHIIMFNPANGLVNEVVEALRWVGVNEGIGHYKSIGFGRFNITNFSEGSKLESPKIPKKGERGYRWKSISPFILAIEEQEKRTNGFSLLSELVIERATELINWGVIDKVTGLQLSEERIRFVYRPELVRRISLETGHRLLRLAGGVESVLQIDDNALGEADLEVINKSLYLGIGHWRECGFGRFEPKSEN
jgi:hypothetical protein